VTNNVCQLYFCQTWLKDFSKPASFIMYNKYVMRQPTNCRCYSFYP